MLRTLVISSFLIAGAVSVASADIYRWVDDHGGVHYSDQWVPGSQLIKSSKPHPSTTASTSASRHAAESPKPTPTPTSVSSRDPNAVRAMNEDKAKVRDQQCKDAKERYNKAIDARRLYKTPDGEADKHKDEINPPREYLSDEEADAYRVKARQDMQELCGDAPK